MSFDLSLFPRQGQPPLDRETFLAYYRPHTFGLEAERIITPFVEQFQLVVDDPQTEGMGRGDYSQETAPRNLARWVAGAPAWPGKPDVVAMDQVLDSDLISEDSNRS